MANETQINTEESPSTFSKSAYMQNITHQPRSVSIKAPTNLAVTFTFPSFSTVFATVLEKENKMEC